MSSASRRLWLVFSRREASRDSTWAAIAWTCWQLLVELLAALAEAAKRHREVVLRGALPFLSRGNAVLHLRHPGRDVARGGVSGRGSPGARRETSRRSGRRARIRRAVRRAHGPHPRREARSSRSRSARAKASSMRASRTRIRAAASSGATLVGKARAGRRSGGARPRRGRGGRRRGGRPPLGGRPRPSGSGGGAPGAAPGAGAPGGPGRARPRGRRGGGRRGGGFGRGGGGGGVPGAVVQERVLPREQVVRLPRREGGTGPASSGFRPCSRRRRSTNVSFEISLNVSVTPRPALATASTNG